MIETQTEVVELDRLSFQIFGVIVFTTVWFLYAYIGNEPIIQPMV